MSTTQSQPTDYEFRVATATETHPHSGSKDFGEQIGKQAISEDSQNSTYLDLDSDQLTDHATDRQINHYARLELYNRGTHNLKWTRDQSAKHDNDDFLFCDALTSQMGLPSWQKTAVWRAFKWMDMRWFKKFDAKPEEDEESPPQYKQYLVAFCIGALLYNENLPKRCDDWSYYPTKENYPCKSKRYWCPRARLHAQEMGDSGDGHRIIERVAEQLGFSDKQVNACYQMVRAKLQQWLT